MSYRIVVSIAVAVAAISALPARAQLSYSGPEEPFASKEAALPYQRADQLEAQGETFLKNKDWSAAAKAFRDALAVRPSPGCYRGLAEISVAQGKDRNAVEMYRKAIYPSPEKNWMRYENSPEFLMTFALLLNKVGEWQEAVAIYSHGAPFATQGYGSLIPFAVTEDFRLDFPEPKRFEAAARLALGMELAFRRHQGEAGRAELSKALAIRPNHARALFYYGQSLLMDKGDVAAAAPYLAKAERAAQFQGDKAVREAIAAAASRNYRSGDLRTLMDAENARAKAAPAERTRN